MIKQIWKFPLELNGACSITMPKGSEILTVQTQYNKPCIWALVDPKAVMTERIFYTYGTGHPVEDMEKTYVGTYQLNAGAFVLHVFEA